MKAWSGRFKKETHQKVEEFTSSLPYDCVLYSYDIEQSKAYAEALAEAKVISKKDSDAVKKGLDQIKKEIEAGKFSMAPELEDIHMAIEQSLIKKTGKPALALQTGRSRNDQVTTSLRMFLMVEIAECIGLVENFQNLIVNMADDNTATVMPGYTHLQKAQPVTLAHHLMAYFWMMERDKKRLADCFGATDEMPLGSGALSGTPYDINRRELASKLGFSRITMNSLDAVSSRDFVAQFLSAAAISLTNLSRMAEEIIIWSSQEFGFIEIDDAFATGSSLMPQKKNPDIAELVRAKAPMASANFSALLGIIKALPLSYNRDLQEDKKLLLDSLDMYEDCLEIMTLLLGSLTFNKLKMEQAVEKDYILATEVADYLVSKGVGFREAHEITGNVVQRAHEQGSSLKDLTLGQFQKYSSLFEEDIFAELSPTRAVAKRLAEGGTAPSAVKKQIREARKLIS